jgi:hypothetical protein
MTIYVMDGLSGIIGMVETFQSCIFNLQYYGIDDFQLIVPGTPENVALLAEDRYLVRDQDISGNTYKNVMRIQKTNLTYDQDNGYLLTVSGGGLKTILGHRIIWNQETFEDTIENVVRQVITDNIISPSESARAIPDFVLDSAAGYEDEIETQVFGENISEWLQSIGETYHFGHDVYISGGKYHFRFYQGTDRTEDHGDVMPIIFSPGFDNVRSAIYSVDGTLFKNAALVGGEGEGTDQRTASVGTATGMARREMYVDGSGVSSNGDIITEATYTKLLKQYGKEQLAAVQNSETFEAEIYDGLYQMGRDYFIGDRVSVENGRGITGTARLTGIIESIDGNGPQRTATFEEWEV